MKLITDDYIILDKNLVSIYTNIETFIDAVEEAVQAGCLNCDSKQQAELNNYLSLKASNKESVFLGFFYTIHPVEYDLEIAWTLLKNNEDYRTFLDALADNSIFDISSDECFNKVFGDNIENITVFDTPYTQEFAPDEDDEFDVELDLTDSFLDDEDE
jgi:hypothetical protein